MIRSVALVLLAAALAASTPKEPPSQAERLDGAAMEKLVADEMQLVDHGFRGEAEQALEARIAASTDKLATADLIEAYGFELYTRAEASEDKPALESARQYLRRAVAAYQPILGEDDPDLAAALVNYAEAERALRPDNPDEAADAAYAQAYRIRKARFGGSAPVTLRTQVKIDELKALPSRAGTVGPAADSRVRLAVPGSDESCMLDSAEGGLIFEGAPEALAKLRERAEATGVHLQPCGPMLALQIPPRAKASPIAALINDVAGGRIADVRMRLFRGSR
jgi:tetratricopeptide (TPR) repeat protein